MDKEDWNKLRGLKRLIHDGVQKGAEFVEKHHRHAADKPFDLLETVEPIAAPTKVVRAIHDSVLSVAYEGVRTANQVTETVDDWVVDQLDPEGQPQQSLEDETQSDPDGAQPEPDGA